MSKWQFGGVGMQVWICLIPQPVTTVTSHPRITVYCDFLRAVTVINPGHLKVCISWAIEYFFFISAQWQWCTIWIVTIVVIVINKISSLSLRYSEFIFAYDPVQGTNLTQNSFSSILLWLYLLLSPFLLPFSYFSSSFSSFLLSSWQSMLCSPGCPGILSIDQADHKLPEVCLLLPPKWWD